jgi:hypothetical protein
MPQQARDDGTGVSDYAQVPHALPYERRRSPPRFRSR